ncbi:sugar phosphate isomerase/epimerase family protein [Paenibacillus sp. HB172176]|uniref:sugar phosphate isomerase/epimerase family protein n=1 Tax=Paenibacillus sp. HB172176 TaxID=2493690 RepID=UPI00143BDF01|nr:sugar phosphate isomerase/epimerase family protein [Paenibacillus sp. HB172176]
MLQDRIGVISDEVSSNFIEALDWIVAEGLKFVELRVVNGTNIAAVSDEELCFVKQEVEKRKLQVTAIASPLFKCALDRSRPVSTGDVFGQVEETPRQHQLKLPRLFKIAKALGTRNIRIFSFWREREPSKYEAEIIRYLTEAAVMAQKENIMLLIENEDSCNGGSAREVANYVNKVNSPALRALWDPGNEVFSHNSPYPEGYHEVKDLLHHVHIKDAVTDSQTGKVMAVPVGQGVVPFAQQIKQLEANGYQGQYVIETHYIPEGGTQMQGTAMSLRGLRQALQEIS